MSVIDICTYNGEKELWDLHYNCLKDYVDEFIVIEFDTTFSGETKSPLFTAERHPKVTYRLHTIDDYAKYRDLALSSKNTIGASHWKREFMQKESIKDALTHLKNTDIVFIGDVDEIWHPRTLRLWRSYPLKLRLNVYTYYLNNHSSEQFWGTIVAPYSIIKDSVLNHLRVETPRSKEYLGWHFTSLAKDLQKKLTDSYTQESYATPEVMMNLEYNIEHNRDFLGRNFTYECNEGYWPDFLKRNKGNYQHLCLPLRNENNV